MSLRDFWMRVYIAAIRNKHTNAVARGMADQAIEDWKTSWELPK